MFWSFVTLVRDNWHLHSVMWKSLKIMCVLSLLFPDDDHDHELDSPQYAPEALFLVNESPTRII